MLSLRASSATDAGRVRTSNQDRALIADRLVAVADGMGGHAGGEVAAQLAVEGLAWAFDPDRDREGLVEAAVAANRAVYERGANDAALSGMGTTLTAAALVHRRGRDQLVLVNVGDSRAYLLDGRELVQVTEDHSVVEQMVRQGELTEQEALVHPHRHILTRALGIDQGVEVDSFVLDPVNGMRLLICSDGLTNELGPEEIASVLIERRDRAEAANELVRRAVAHGGSDNVTVVVADAVDEEAPATTPSPGLVERDDKATNRVIHSAPRPPAPRTRPPREPRAHGAPSPKTRRQAPPRAPARSRHDDRIVTPFVAGFVLVLVALLGGIIGFTVWFNRGTYYVGLDRGSVAIFEGRPGGYLWFQPTVVRRTQLSEKQVLDANLPLLRSGVLESSYTDAEQVVSDLENERNLLGLALPTSTTTTVTAPTTTVVKRATSTTAAR